MVVFFTELFRCAIIELFKKLVKSVRVVKPYFFADIGNSQFGGGKVEFG